MEQLSLKCILIFLLSIFGGCGASQYGDTQRLSSASVSSTVPGINYTGYDGQTFVATDASAISVGGNCSNASSVIVSSPDDPLSPYTASCSGGTFSQSIDLSSLTGGSSTSVSFTPIDSGGSQGSTITSNYSASYGYINYRKSFSPGNQSAKTLAIGDLNGDGNKDVIVAFNGSNLVHIHLGLGDGTFSNSTTHTMVTGANDLKLFDLDKNGSLDLIATNGVASALYIAMGNGDGTFDPTNNYPTGQSPKGFAIGYLDAGTTYDIALTCAFNDQYMILFGDGDGVFNNLKASTLTNISGDGPMSVELADFNADNNLDMIMSHQYSNFVSLFLGAGDGTFGAEDTYSLAGISTASLDIVVGDLNGDTRPDILTATGSADKVATFLNTGTNTPGSIFAAGVGHSMSTDSVNLYSVATKDINGDGNLDMLSANSGSGSQLQIRYGDGTGGFGAFSEFSMSSYAYEVLVDDFNNDGYEDVITSAYTGQGFSIRLGSSQGFLKEYENFNVGSNPHKINFTDVNKDGNIDLLSSNLGDKQVSVHLGDGAGNYGAATSYPMGASWGVRQVESVDINGDTWPDMISSNMQDWDISVRFNDGAGLFLASTTYDMGNNPSDISLVDINGDGDLDILAASSGSFQVISRLNDGSGGFGATNNTGYVDTIALPGGPQAIDTGLINNDSDVDFVSANGSNNTVSVSFGNGDGTFAAVNNLAVGTGPKDVKLADLNKDGELDIITANGGSNDVSVLLGDGNATGTFNASAEYDVGKLPSHLFVIDINGDTNLDVVSANQNSGDVTILLGDGLGAFSSINTISTDSDPNDIKVVDFNGDGELDIVTSVKGTTRISILLKSLFLAP